MIILETIRWQNFLSTGNSFTEVSLNKAKTMLICGENGSGKSTIMDAITFALFNKPFRRINKPQLINAVNDKNCLVELEFNTGRNKYLIRRGIKPHIFEIHKNGKMLDQSADNRDYQDILEKRVIGMNYKTFCQIVILGSANWTAFMSLRGYDRRKVIEDLLDIEVFSVMNTLLKTKATESKNRLVDLNTRIAILENTIALNKEHKAALKKNRQTDINKKKTEITNQQQSVEKLQKEVAEHEKEVESLSRELEEISAIRRNIQDVKAKIAKASRIKGKLKEDIEFYEENNNCPTCTQQIDEDFKVAIIDAKTAKQIQADDAIDKLEKMVAKLETSLAEFESLQEKLKVENNNLSKCLTSISVSSKIVSRLQHEIDELQTTVNQEVKEGNEVSELKSTNKDKAKLLDEREVLNIASILLKDNGIKTQIIRQYIPIMNTLINKYLERMEFFCSFSLDENFQEQIKSRHKDVFSYDSFSQGEKMRIDLALLFTWREISKMRNSSPINLLLLDEIMDSSLDSAGTDEFINIISQLTGGTNVVIISHKADQISDKFDKVITVEKTKNFTHYKEIA